MGTVVMDGCTKGSPLHWKLLKPYDEADSKSTMVVIQCPHCGDDIELEDGTSGLFDCPYCDNEFPFGDVKYTVLPLYRRLQLFLSTGMIIGLAIIVIGVITFIGFAIFSDDTGDSWSYMWIFYPCGILAIGIPIVVISFLIRGYQLNWEV